MSHRRYGFGALGVCLMAAFGLMAFVASAAQAHPEYYVEASLLSGSKLVLVGSASGNLTVPALSAVIDCASGGGDGTISNAGGTGVSEGTVTFSNCQVLGPQCTVEEPIEAAVKDHLVLHEGETYDIFEPPTGPTGTFTTLVFEGTFCTLPEEVGIHGSTAVLVDDPATELLSHSILSSAAISHLVCELLTNVCSGLLFGTNEAVLTGEASLFLQSDELWSAH